MVIGSAPLRTELAHDTPFLGHGGKLLWGVMAKKCELGRADCYMLNTIGEWPQGKNETPLPAQYERWWDQFDEALAKFTGSTILILGAEAFYRMMGYPRKGRKDDGLQAWRGYLMGPEDLAPLTRRKEVQAVYKSSGKNKAGVVHKKGDVRITHVKIKSPNLCPESVRYIIPTLSGETVIRTGFGQSPAFSADIARVGRAVRGTLRPVGHTYREGAPLIEVENQCRAPSPTSIDIETRMGGLDADSIERIGVANDHGCWTAVWDVAARHGTNEALSRSSVSIAHNIGFDAPRLRREGVIVPEPWWDTMYAALLLQPDLLKGLNGVIPLYLDAQRHKHLSDAEPARYNALDTIRELELYHVLREHLVHTGQVDLFENTMMRALPVLVEMGEQGVRMDLERQVTWTAALEQRRADALAEWYVRAPGINPFSPQQLKSFLYGTLGLPEQLSRVGGATTDSGALGELLGRKEVQPHRATLELLLSLRDANKQLETYAKVFVSEDGHIHPSWIPAGKDAETFGQGIAGTGRITSRGINFQNVSPEAKKLYIPRAGCVFIEADWNQIEARVVAALSEDAGLLHAIATGLHQSNMAALGVDKTRAKNFFYGWSYGAGARTLRRTFLAHGFDISEAECKEKLKLLETTYPDVTRWRQDVAQRAAQTYRLVNSFGRRRNFLRGSGDTPAALNFLPQSVAADCMWAVIRPLSDALGGIGARLCGTIHDSILIECPSGVVAEGAEILRNGMQREFPQVAPGFSVPVEVKVGMNWGEMRSTEQESGVV